MLGRDMLAEVLIHDSDVLFHVIAPFVPKVRGASAQYLSQRSTGRVIGLPMYLWFLMIALSALRPPRPPCS